MIEGDVDAGVFLEEVEDADAVLEDGGFVDGGIFDVGEFLLVGCFCCVLF